MFSKKQTLCASLVLVAVLALTLTVSVQAESEWVSSPELNCEEKAGVNLCEYEVDPPGNASVVNIIDYEDQEGIQVFEIKDGELKKVPFMQRWTSIAWFNTETSGNFLIVSKGKIDTVHLLAH